MSADDPGSLPGTEDQPNLYPDEELAPDWKTAWQGMPDYDHDDLMPWQTLRVHFKTIADREAFAKLVGQTIHSKTQFIWYPKAEIKKASDKVFTRSGKVTPRYPVYIISKGRWESRLTSKSLEWLQVPYHIVVEPQEYEQYAAVIDPAKILTLPFSNLGLGGIPARNWVWEHAVASGAERHWILDDNIGGFCRFQDNLKVEVDSGATFCAAEDFVDRYENVVMAAFNYDYFAPRKQGSKIRPITLNTRCYSGILLSNKIPHRWRGRYNEDTDLSLRILKDGYCTVLFNAFLMYKMPTLTMKGGNTDELYKGVETAQAEWESHAAACSICKRHVDGYGVTDRPYGPMDLPCKEGLSVLAKDGRWLMAESLREQHPDQVVVERKWKRWQHQVDYRRFRENKLILKKGIVVADGTDDYGMTLDAMPKDEVVGYVGQKRASDRPAAPLAPSPISALDFALRSSFAPAESQPVAAGPSTGPSGPGETPASLERPALASQDQPESARDGSLDSLPEALRAGLEMRGHRLFVRDGKLFATNPSTLTDADREDIAECREELIALLTSEVEPRRELEKPTQTLAQFLGTEPPRVDPSWKPDEIPDLSNVDEIVLNFATDGLDWAGGSKPVGVTVSTLDGQLTRFLPFGFAGGNLDRDQVLAFLRGIKHKKIYNANTRFDLHMGRNVDVDFEEQGCTFSDIQHTAALLDDHRKQFRLDKLAEDYLPGEPFVGRVDESQHAGYHAAEVAERERFTARLVGRLRDVMYPELDKQELRDVQNLEDQVIPCVVEMEKNGALIDLELLEQYSLECNRRHDNLLMEIAREVGFGFDHTNKSWQRLFETLGLPATDSIAEDVIGIIDHPLVKKAHLAAQYASLNSKIFKSYKERADQNGIIRFELNQLRGEGGGTVTGRFSAGIIQQVPNYDNHSAVFGDDLFPRRLYIPAKGMRYLAADAEQIQYRIFAHYANNPKILEMYAKDPRASFHKMMMALLLPYKPDLVYGHVKNMNFMKIFGGGLAKLAMMMGLVTQREVEELQRMGPSAWSDPRLAKAKEIQTIYDTQMPEVGRLLAQAMHLAKTECDKDCKTTGRHAPVIRKFHADGLPHRGYVKTILGRRSRFPDNYRLHKAFCMVDQGSEGDIVKTKIVELHAERKRTGFLMRTTVHDEVTGDAQAPDTMMMVDEILNRQSFPQLKVPILWSVKEGANWAECK